MGSNTLESRDAEENAQQFEKKNKNKNKNKQRYYQSRDNTYTRHNSWVSTSKVVEILFSDSLSFIIL